MLPNNVKLVVWDLDDTFWEGTLAEGEITPIPANIEIVKTLCGRGIMSSISSKNILQKAREVLTKLDVWDYFVFPKIKFAPKGGLVAALVEEMNLRHENVLFIEDLHLNREEVRHYCPGIMIADPAEILDELLSLPQLQGKDDAGLSRLAQYKNLERKAVSRVESKLENEDFLRGCDIRVRIGHDLDADFDRIVELANRSNQLNYTKVRLETPEAVAGFRALCDTYAISVGTVRVADKYGDYGMVGYYVLRTIGPVKELLHFAFSCRTMNMGIEQYIFERLREPDCRIVGEVANPIKTFGRIDWITEGAGDVTLGALAGDKKLVLIGGCELRQLASLCSTNRAEYVNEVENGNRIRHDDFGFVLTERAGLREDQGFAKSFAWRAESAEAFDKDVASSRIVIASMFRAMSLDYFKTHKGTWLGLDGFTLNRHLRKLGPKFVRNFWFVPMSQKERFARLRAALDRMAALAPPEARLFALGVSTWLRPSEQKLTDAQKWERDFYLGARRQFNSFVAKYCAESTRYDFVDLNKILTEADMVTPTHFHRKGYLAMAKFIADCLNERAAAQTILVPESAEA